MWTRRGESRTAHLHPRNHRRKDEIARVPAREGGCRRAEAAARCAHRTRRRQSPAATQQPPARTETPGSGAAHWDVGAQRTVDLHHAFRGVDAAQRLTRAPPGRMESRALLRCAWPPRRRRAPTAGTRGRRSPYASPHISPHTPRRRAWWTIWSPRKTAPGQSPVSTP